MIPPWYEATPDHDWAVRVERAGKHSRVVLHRPSLNDDQWLLDWSHCGFMTGRPFKSATTDSAKAYAERELHYMAELLLREWP